MVPPQKFGKRKIYLAAVAVLLISIFVLSFFAALYILHRPGSGSTEVSEWVTDITHFDGFSSVGTFIQVSELGNGFVLTGTLADGNLALLRTGASVHQAPLWQKTYGAGSGNAVLQTSEGDFLVAATKFALNGSEQTNSSWLIKTDSAGNLQWSQEYAGNGFAGIANGTDGYVLLGRFDVEGVDYPGLLKVDNDGNVQWTMTYSSSQAPVLKLYRVISTSDGGYGLVGEMQYTVNGVVMRNGWFVKTDADGEVQINRPFAMKGCCVLNSLVETEDGFVLVGSTAASADDIYSACLIGTDAGGHSQWSRVNNALENCTGNGGGFEYYSVARAENGTLFVAGYLSGVGATVQLIDSTGDTALYDVQTDVAQINYLTSTNGDGYAYAGHRDGSVWLVYRHLVTTLVVT